MDKMWDGMWVRSVLFSQKRRPINGLSRGRGGEGGFEPLAAQNDDDSEEFDVIDLSKLNPIHRIFISSLFFVFSRNDDYKEVISSSGQKVFVRHNRALENRLTGTTTDYN